MIRSFMLQIQPESELNSLYSLNNSSGQLKWHMDEEFNEYRENSSNNTFRDLAAFFWEKGLLFEFCLLVEGCQKHNIDHGFPHYEQKVAQTLSQVRG